MISNDICRCHDRHCQQRHDCERWIWRKDAGRWIAHCMSLRDAVTKKCDYYQSVKTKEPDET